MRVLFTVSAWRGHYYPMVPVAWALQAAGHDVRVACAASESGHLRAAGLVPVPVLHQLDMLLHARFNNAMLGYARLWQYPTPPPDPVTGADTDDAGQRGLPKLLREVLPRMEQAQRDSAAGVVAFARDWRPELVVYDLLSTEGLLVGGLTGVPAVLHLWGPVGTHEPGLDLIPKDHARVFHAHGLPPPHADQISHVLDPCPPGVRPQSRADRIPVRFVPYNGPGAHTAAPPPGRRPRVCLIWGNSTAKIFGQRVFAGPKLLAALAGLSVDVDLVANRADVDALGPLPANVTVRENVPLHLVLPGCALVIHHGGAGSTMTALAAGVPQLAIPHGLDQFLIGGRIEAAGAGRCLPNYACDAADVTAAVSEMLADRRYADGAAALAEQSAQLPAPNDIVDNLAALAAGSR